jgi:ribosomal protein L33
MQKVCENCGQKFEFRFKGKYRNSKPGASLIKRNKFCPDCRKKHAKEKSTT